MKYMILMAGSQQHYDAMAGKSDVLPNWSPSDMQAMFDHMNALNEELRHAGEWVDGQGLTDPKDARRVQLEGDKLVVTDGPYAETKEVLAGYWVVECDSLERATEIAERAARCPVPEGFPTGVPVDIRPIGEGPKSDA